MDSYAKQFEKAKSKGDVTNVSCDIHRWDESGDVIIGKILAIEDFTGGKYETACKKYTIETDEGIISTILGSVADMKIAEIGVENPIVRIEYQGKGQTENGNNYNKFFIEVIR